MTMKNNSTSKSASLTQLTVLSQKEIDEAVLIPLLVARSCHLPGNSWFYDWCQFFKNQHLLFGICLHHPLHPLETWERVVACLGSISFGLAASTIIRFWDRYDPEAFDRVLFVVPYDGQYAITYGMVMLWTVGGICHSLYDYFVWNIMACGCCHPGGRWGTHENSGRFRDVGSYFLIPVVLGLMAIATLAVLARASQLEREEAGNYDDDGNITFNDFEGLQSFSFLTEYAIELALAWLVYFPIVGTILFSGILGCNGRLPILGGRPRDKKRYEEGKFGAVPGNVYSMI